MKMRHFDALSCPKNVVISALLSMWMTFSVCYAGEIAFENVTAQSLISYSGPSYGASWGDFNGDGLPDLWTGNHGNPNHPPSLWLNLGDGTFGLGNIPVEVDRGDFHGASWADYDNDGDQDLLVQVGALGGAGSDPNRFFENQNGVLIEKASLLGLDYPLGRGRTPLWLDWNNDGKLDVILTNVARLDGQAPTALFSQNNNGIFIDSFATTGFQTSNIWNTFSHLVTLDVQGLEDNKTKVDLIFVHSFAYPDHIYAFHNSSLINVKFQSGSSMSNTRDVAVGDFSGDLLTDIYLAKTAPGNVALSDMLLLQETNRFIDSSFLLANIASTPCESVAAADFDNDMDLDIYLVCLGGPTSNSPNILLENLGSGEFRQVLQAGGAEGSNEGRGESVVSADYDRDGYMDLLVTNGRGGSEVSNGPTQLFRNLGGSNHWLEIDLEGVVSNRDAIGARIILTAGGVSQLREQLGGMHRFSQHHKRMHFGLAGNSQIDELTIEWPSGIIQNVTNLPVDQIIHIVEKAGSTPNAPVLTITANGNENSLTINRNENLKINISLEDNGINSKADWWIFADSEQYGHFESPPYQSELIDLPPTEIFNSTLPSGTWVFRFIIDTLANGVLSPDDSYEATVLVEVL